MLVVGDSQVYGLGVEDDAIFSSVLAASAKNTTVLNGGVPTYGPFEYAALVDEVVRTRKPLHVVFVVNLANDLFEATRKNEESEATANCDLMNGIVIPQAIGGPRAISLDDEVKVVCADDEARAGALPVCSKLCDADRPCAKGKCEPRADVPLIAGRILHASLTSSRCPERDPLRGVWTQPRTQLVVRHVERDVRNGTIITDAKRPSATARPTTSPATICAILRRCVDMTAPQI